MIIFDQVTKTFPNGDSILDDISLKIDPQEFVVIQGPSGSGKTTLLRLIYKDTIPSKGSITIDGEDLSKISRSSIPNFRRKIGFAFQDFKIIPDKTLWENLSLPLEILNFKDDIIKDRIDHLLELIDLGSKAHLFPRQLSGGELQRVGIARAIAAEPTILLADEPTGNLDPQTSLKIVNLLEEINKIGTTVLMASHDNEAIHKLHVRHIHLKDGKIVDEDHHHSSKKKADHSDKEEVKESKS